MRLFIAFDISKETESHLFELQKKLQTDNAKITLTKSFHLTLKFLGEVTPTKAEEIKKRLQSVQFKPFTAMLDRTGIFPSDKMIRVVWVGLEPSDIIGELQKNIDEALSDLFPKEERFQAHLTLARVKFVKNKELFAESVKNLPVKPIKFEVKEFKLIESQLRGKQGPLYREIAVYQ